MITFPRYLCCQCGGGLVCSWHPSLPCCLVATFGGGLYHYKHKPTLFKKAMFFKMLLLQLPSLILILLLIMSNVTVLSDITIALCQDCILVEFAPHTDLTFTLFAETLQESHDIVIKKPTSMVNGQIPTTSKI